MAAYHSGEPHNRNQSIILFQIWLEAFANPDPRCSIIRSIDSVSWCKLGLWDVIGCTIPTCEYEDNSFSNSK